MKRTSFAAKIGIAASVALTMFAAPASAQTDDVNPEEVEAAVRYALPYAFDGYLTKCAAGLDADGYSFSNAEQLRAKFSDGSDAYWPDAKAFLLEMASSEADGMGSVLGMLGDDELKPFVNGVVAALTAEELKVESCSVIERALEIIDPLPADNVAALFGFFAEFGLASSDQSTLPIGDVAQ